MKNKSLILGLIIIFITFFSLTGCKQKYTLTVTAETGGSFVVEQGEAATSIIKTVPKETKTTLKAIPFAGYAFDKWMCNSLDIYSTEKIEISVDKNTVCSAKFTFVGNATNSINITKEGEGTVLINGEERDRITLATGSTVHLYAESQTGYIFSSWVCDNTYNDNKISLVLNKDYNCTVTFSENPKINNYEVSISNKDGGTEYLNGSSLLKQNFNENENVNLLAVPDEGYEFVNWTCGSNIYSNSNQNITIISAVSCFPTYQIKDDYSLIRIYKNLSITNSVLVRKGLDYEFIIPTSFDLDYYTINNIKYENTLKLSRMNIMFLYFLKTIIKFI